MRTRLGQWTGPSEVARRRVLQAMALAAVAVPMSACASAAPVRSPRHSQAWGAFIPRVQPADANSASPIEQLAALAGRPPKYLHCFAAIGDSAPTGDLSTIADAGATPLLTLEPWWPGAGTAQPSYAMSRFAGGDFDSDLRRWGSELASWGRPVLLRFAQEMNGTWYPWSIGLNGNTTNDYRTAWTRMHALISADADNVEFVWAPNVRTEGTRPFTDCYPGHDVVDHLGLDGYNWGNSPGHHWQPADALFSASLLALTELGADQPILITEVACADGPQASMKADWIRDFFEIVQTQDRLAGFLWFQMDKERDWRFNSTAASTDAFRTGLATPTV